MFVPLLLDQVRVKDRTEVFLVFRLDRDKQTADLLCLGPDIVERGVHWTMLEDAWDDWGWNITPAGTSYISQLQ